MVQLSDDCFAFAGDLMMTQQALDLIQARVVPVTKSEPVCLRDAVGRILAEEVIAGHNVPPHDNSAVDGFAFAHEALGADAETRLRIAGRAAAGHPLEGVPASDEAVRIFTGAPMPHGCDTVAMQEDCRAEGGCVVIPRGLMRGDNRRRAGEDVAAGRTILSVGQRLRPQDIGLAASVGRTELAAYRRLRVAVFSTGDEVREPGQRLAPGAVYDANRYVLMALLHALGMVVADLGILPDRIERIRSALAEAARDNDVVITSGGVSVGEEDRVKEAVEAAGNLHFWRLAIKPGRPLAMGQIGGTPFIGLPGNPVAAMVTFVRFARPLLLLLAGAGDVAPQLFRVYADFDHTKKRDRREWVRSRLVAGADGKLLARKFEREGAGILTSLVDADGLVELPEDMTHLEAGAQVDFLPFTEVS